MITNNIDLTESDFQITADGVFTVDLADTNTDSGHGLIMPDPASFPEKPITIINRDPDNLAIVKGNTVFQSNVHASNIVIYTSNGVDWYGIGNI